MMKKNFFDQKSRSSIFSNHGRKVEFRWQAFFLLWAGKLFFVEVMFYKSSTAVKCLCMSIAHFQNAELTEWERNWLCFVYFIFIFFQIITCFPYTETKKVSKKLAMTSTNAFCSEVGNLRPAGRIRSSKKFHPPRNLADPSASFIFDETRTRLSENVYYVSKAAPKTVQRTFYYFF